jgi:hypothetical protein
MGTTNVTAPADDHGSWVNIDCNAQLYAGTIATLRTNLTDNRTSGQACWVTVTPTA